MTETQKSETTNDADASGRPAAAGSTAPERGHPRYRLDSGRIVAFMGSPGGFWQVHIRCGFWQSHVLRSGRSAER